MNNKIEYVFEKGEITFSINTKGINDFVKGILSFLIIGGMLTPFIILTFLEEVNFGFIISMFIFFGVSFLFLRILLWNLKGKECYSIYKNKFVQYNDYAWFKSSVREFDLNEFEINTLEGNYDNLYRLEFVFRENNFSSVIDLSEFEIKELIKKIEDDFQKVNY